MEADKVLDAYRSQPGYAGQQADGKQAHTQTTLEVTETWERLPRNRWSSSFDWHCMDTPIQGFWEQHCERMLREVGFELVFPYAWPSVF